jgi:RNA polymerase sigma-70 factor, ECF subfamily
MGTLTCTLDKMSPIPELPVEHRETLLIRQILAGRRDLFGDLIEPHLDAVSRAVRSRMGNDPDIDDVAQQAVFKAFTHLDQFRFEGGFRTWLIRIALNEVIQNWRKRIASRSVRMEPSAIAAVSVTDPKDSPYHLCMRSQTAGLLQSALATLPESYRLVVRMRDFEERSISEVADALRLTASAVKTRHHRARLRMAKILSELNTAPGRNLTQ